MNITYKLLKDKGFKVYHYDSVKDINKNILSGKSAYLKASHAIGLEELIK